MELVYDFLLYALLAGTAVYCITIYNGLVRLRNNVERAFANIEVSLKQRHTELPMLVEVCKGYMKHEREVLVAIVEARSRVHRAQAEHDIRELGKAETQMRQSLSNLFARVEDYPDLKANENMKALSERISVLEDVIADRREIYNESVRLNNTRIQEVPDVIFANIFRFEEHEYLSFEADAMQATRISL
jgi:LemA protein